MKKIYSPAVTDVFAAIGIIAAFYSVLAIVAFIVW
jgi:hypothetical protein